MLSVFGVAGNEAKCKRVSVDIGCISSGKILIRMLDPKADFLFLWQNQKRIMHPMNPYATKIQWINPNSDSKDSRLLCFFGKDSSMW